MKRDRASLVEPRDLLPKTLLKKKFMASNLTHSILHLTSHHFVSIAGQHSNVIFYPDTNSTMEDKKQQMISTGASAILAAVDPVSSASLALSATEMHAVPLKKDEVNKDTISITDNISTMTSEYHTFSQPGSNTTKGLPNFNLHTDILSSSLLPFSESLPDESKHSLGGLPLESHESLTLDRGYNTLFPYEQKNQWSAERSPNCFYTNNSGSIGSGSQAVENNSLAHSSFPDVFHSLPSSSQTSLHPSVQLSLEYSKQVTSDKDGVTPAHVRPTVLDLTNDNDTSDYFCSKTYLTERVPGSPLKKLHTMDYTDSDDGKSDIVDPVFLGGNENEVITLPSQPQHDIAAWVDSFRNDDDSGCLDDISAQSPNPEDPQDCVAKLGAILQEKVSAEVRNYINSVKGIVMDCTAPAPAPQEMQPENNQQAAIQLEVENEVNHARFLLKLHQYSAKITRLILKKTFSSLLTTGESPQQTSKPVRFNISGDPHQELSSSISTPSDVSAAVGRAPSNDSMGMRRAPPYASFVNYSNVQFPGSQHR